MKSVNDILAPDWFSYMDYLSGGDNVINYSWKKSGISKKERKEIKYILREIDDLTGISFVKLRSQVQILSEAPCGISLEAKLKVSNLSSPVRFRYSA